MLTTSAAFDTFASSAGHQRDVILIVSLGATNRYFSMRPMPQGLGTSAVYPLLHSVSDITEGFDIYSKHNQISDVKFILSDERFFPQNGTAPIRASELLEDLNGAIITLCLWVDGITDINDCLVIFKGKVLQALNIANSRAQFSAHSIGKLWDATIPTRTIEQQWPNAPKTALLLPIPLVYGIFNGADPYLNNSNATGLLRAIAYERILKSNYVVADHPTVGAAAAWLQTGANSVVSGIGGGFNNDDNGISRVIPTLLGKLTFQLSPTLPGVFNDEATYTENQTNRNNLADENASTRCNFSDNLFDDGDNVQGLALWGIELEELFRSHIQNNGSAQLIGFDLNADGAWPENEITQINAYLYHGIDGSNDLRTLMGACTKSGGGGFGIIVYSGNLDMGSAHVRTADLSADITIGFAYVVAFAGFAGVIGSVADTIINNQVLFSMADAHIDYWHYVTMKQPFTWIVSNGKAAGNAITVGRSNPYSNVSINQDPALIIEDLYRTFIGLSDVEIDTASFDAGFNANVKTRINIINKQQVNDLVRAISEQSTILTYISGVGQLKCINLDDKTPTINATITRNQLVGDEFKLSKTTFIINDLNVKSRWQEEYGDFKDEDTFVDTDSQVQVGTRTGHFDWKFLNGTDNAYVGNHYVNSDDGIWSKEHIQVIFTTAGFTHSHLQAGDWINFARDIDDIRMAYGRTWDDIDLLIVKTQKGSSSTTITAIELYRPVIEVSPEPSPSPPPSPTESGLYDRDANVNITLQVNNAMSDTITNVEVGSDLGYIALNDHYGLDFTVNVELNTTGTFRIYTSRTLSALTNGACKIYYSDDNATWTQWGTTRSYLNGGLHTFFNLFLINGDGDISESHRYWKFFVVSTFSDGGTIELTELTANEV